MSIYAIGDIQGCYSALDSLLKKINYRPERDFLWFCGDIVNRGPDSLKTLAWVSAKVEAGEAKMVLGNHDLHFLAVALGFRQLKSGDTLEPLLVSKDKNYFIDFYRQQPLCYFDVEQDYFLVHAGLIPQWDGKFALKVGAEVEQILLNDLQFPSFLQAMYGNYPTKWDETLTGTSRLRFITNVLTRIRFCYADGSLDLVNDGNLNSAVSGTKAWFQFEQRASKQDRVLFGHWAALYRDWQTAWKSGVFPLDSGCVWGNALTAFNLETQCYTHSTYTS